jgi:hypothetical protein
LVSLARRTGAWNEFRDEHEYFATEFAAFSRAERGSAVAPVLNKIRALVADPYLRALLCSESDTLRLDTLWETPRLLAVHVDAWSLGSDGARLLSGMLTHALFNAAMRRSGHVPVVLMLDEMGMQERFAGRAIRDVLAMARSQNLRMLAACQFLDQLSDGLRSALLANTALRVFFRLGPEDARRVAGSLAAGAESRTVRIAIDTAKRGKYDPPDTESVSHVVVDMWDRPLAASDVAWEEFSRVQAGSACGASLLCRWTLPALAAVRERAPCLRTAVCFRRVDIPLYCLVFLPSRRAAQ